MGRYLQVLATYTLEHRVGYQKECSLAVKALREPHGYFLRQILLILMWSYMLVLGNSFLRFCRTVGFGWLVIFTAVAWVALCLFCLLAEYVGQP